MTILSLYGLKAPLAYLWEERVLNELGPDALALATPESSIYSNIDEMYFEYYQSLSYYTIFKAVVDEVNSQSMIMWRQVLLKLEDKMLVATELICRQTSLPMYLCSGNYLVV